MMHLSTSPKSIALRTMIRSEFNKSRLLSPDSPADAVKIEALKANAVRALSNYMLYEGGIQDKRKGGKLGAAMDTYHERSLEGIQQNKKDERRRPGGNNKTETWQICRIPITCYATCNINNVDAEQRWLIIDTNILYHAGLYKSKSPQKELYVVKNLVKWSVKWAMWNRY